MNNIRKLRRDRNMSQSELAKKAGISRGYLVMLENGRQENVTVKVLVAVAEALGTNVAALLQNA